MCDDCIMVDPDETEMKMRRRRQVDVLDQSDEYLEYRIARRQQAGCAEEDDE